MKEQITRNVSEVKERVVNEEKIWEIGILFVLELCICTGCAKQMGDKYTTEDLDNLAEIRIYSAEDNELIKTVRDEEQLYQYNQSISFFDDSYTEEYQEELEKDLKDAKEQYNMISYKYPVAQFGPKELEENIIITLYEDKSIIKILVSEENIKAFSMPKELFDFLF